MIYFSLLLRILDKRKHLGIFSYILRLTLKNSFGTIKETILKIKFFSVDVLFYILFQGYLKIMKQTFFPMTDSLANLEPTFLQRKY